MYQEEIFYGTVLKDAKKLLSDSTLGTWSLTNPEEKLEKVNLINKYQSQGYYLAVEVKGTTGQHWVAVMSVNGYTINMVDPGSDGTDMWSSYNWKNTSQFVYFKTK